jgi:hypothetical protein
MAKQQGKAAAQATPAKGGGKKIERKRRNALERKCLPKAYKALFARDGRAAFKSILAAWQEGRKKVKEVDLV